MYQDIEELDIDLPMTKVVTLMDQTNFLNSVQSFLENFKSFLTPEVLWTVPLAEAMPAFHDNPYDDLKRKAANSKENV